MAYLTATFLIALIPLFHTYMKINGSGKISTSTLLESPPSSRFNSNIVRNGTIARAGSLHGRRGKEMNDGVDGADTVPWERKRNRQSANSILVAIEDVQDVYRLNPGDMYQLNEPVFGSVVEDEVVVRPPRFDSLVRKGRAGEQNSQQQQHQQAMAVKRRSQSVDLGMINLDSFSTAAEREKNTLLRSSTLTRSPSLNRRTPGVPRGSLARPPTPSRPVTPSSSYSHSRPSTPSRLQHKSYTSIPSSEYAESDGQGRGNASLGRERGRERERDQERHHDYIRSVSRAGSASREEWDGSGNANGGGAESVNMLSMDRFPVRNASLSRSHVGL